MQDLIQFAQDEIKAGHRLMLLLVAQTRGSSPGRPGFKIMVSASGRHKGSIGGGLMEYNMVELAREKLRHERSPDAGFFRQVHSADAGPEASGLICRGEQINLMLPLIPGHTQWLDEIDRALSERRPAILELNQQGVRVISEKSQAMLNLGDASLQTEEKPIFRMHDDQWFFSELIFPMPDFYIFGGGHLSLPLSQLLSMLGFWVTVIDSRPELDTMQQNTWAREKIIREYEGLDTLIRNPQRAGVAIMTVSHASDQQILRQMASLPLMYLGMIGSRAKVQKIFSSLQEEGIGEEQLKKVDAPMGVAIGSETVAEIAVSIAARVIQKKNTGR